MRRGLDANSIVATLERLQARIGERFPSSGLHTVCGEVVEVGRTTAERARQIGRPNIVLRAGIATALVAGVVVQVYVARSFHLDLAVVDATLAVQIAEAGANLVVLVGAAVLSLGSMEARQKRRAVLAALHELRSYAHIVDMHQLTKDPTVILHKAYVTTEHSPARAMTRFHLTRYLEYCAEALALIGKLAALYGERMQDPEVLDAVGDVEDLTTSLGRKIWQKIVILGQLEEKG